MPFNIFGFVVGRVLAEREGVPADQINRVALIGGVTGSSLTGILVAREVAAREAAAARSGEAVATPDGAPPATGTPMVVVPDFVAAGSFEAAQELAKRNRLRAVRVEVINAPHPVGTVHDQKPAAAEVVPAGSAVVLQVSVGEQAPAPGVPASVEVPDLAGQSFEEARLTLHDLNLGVVRVDEPGDERAGTVRSTEPTRGTAVPLNAQVHVRVSDGTVINNPRAGASRVVGAPVGRLGGEAGGTTQTS